MYVDVPPLNRRGGGKRGYLAAVNRGRRDRDYRGYQNCPGCISHINSEQVAASANGESSRARIAWGKMITARCCDSHRTSMFVATLCAVLSPTIEAGLIVAGHEL